MSNGEIALEDFKRIVAILKENDDRDEIVPLYPWEDARVGDELRRRGYKTVVIAERILQ